MYGIMLVDDEPSVLKGLSELMDWSQMDAGILATASGAQEALSMLRKVPVHILITDICMPVMDGLMLIAEAKALNPSLRCIVISAHDEFEYVRSALKLGVENYLLKPINASELAETLTKTIGNIERSGDSAALSRGAVAFRSNILDRWVNSSIQDFELAERAALLQIGLNASEYQALVIVPSNCCNIDERLLMCAAAMETVRHNLADAGFEAEVFIDRHANLAAILCGANLTARRAALEAALFASGEISAGKYFACVGHPVQSAYALDGSYKCAYALLPLRHLDGGVRVAWCGDFDLAAAFSSSEMLLFEQALEASDPAGAAQAAEYAMTRRPQKNFALSLKQLMPYQLRLMSLFDDSKLNVASVPESVIRQLHALSKCADSAALLCGFAAAAAAAVQELKNRRNALHPVVKRAMDIISASYGRDISLKAIADQLNMHPSYFGQLFKEETRQLFNDYLTSLRLKKARGLLARSDRRIGDICCEVGISQQSYFNRLFKKEYGVTPVEYRRAMGEKKL